AQRAQGEDVTGHAIPGAVVPLSRAELGRSRGNPVRSVGDVSVQARKVHGQEASPEAMTSISRISDPAGCRSAVRTAAAVCAGSLRSASGPGRYRSLRPSKNAVRIPPGTSRVTPTRPAYSAASAWVKPRTPNLDAQYAVASPTPLSASVEATVTTVPPTRSR